MRSVSKRHLLFAAVAVFAVIVVAVLFGVSNRSSASGADTGLEVVNAVKGGDNVLRDRNLGEIRRTQQTITDARDLPITNSTTRVFLWNETNSAGETTPMYAISSDGTKVDTVRESSAKMLLRFGKFDPLLSVPAAPQLGVLQRRPKV